MITSKMVLDILITLIFLVGLATTARLVYAFFRTKYWLRFIPILMWGTQTWLEAALHYYAIIVIVAGLYVAFVV